MHLYHSTVQPPTAIQHCLAGNFAGPVLGRQDQLVVCRGSTHLELLQWDLHARRLVSLMAAGEAQPVFVCIRSLSTFRLPSADLDHVVLGADSGKMVVLRFDAKRGLFEKVQEEAFGRSGSRRTVPGQYVAADPHGRAIMTCKCGEE